MKSAKVETEELLNAAIPFAERMLSEHGEFLPYAEALGSDGEFVSIGATDGRERPPSADVIQLLRGGLKAGAKSGKYRATALVYDVRIALPSSSTKSDAIAVSLNHRDRYSVLVYFPYRLEGRRVVLGDAIAQRAQRAASPPAEPVEAVHPHSGLIPTSQLEHPALGKHHVCSSTLFPPTNQLTAAKLAGSTDAW